MSNNQHGINAAETRRLAEAFLAYWSVQDVANTIALMSNDIVSVVHLDEAIVGMSGTIVGAEAVEEGLFRNLKIWHYLKFDGQITRVIDDIAVVQIEFDYEHQLTRLRHAGTMRKHITVRHGHIMRVEVYHDAMRIEAYMGLVRQREAELLAARHEAEQKS